MNTELLSNDLATLDALDSADISCRPSLRIAQHTNFRCMLVVRCRVDDLKEGGV